MTLGDLCSSLTATFTRKWIALIAIAFLVILVLFTHPQSPSDDSNVHKTHFNVRNPASRQRQSLRWSQHNSNQEQDAPDQNIHAKEQLKWTWDFSGHCFDEAGATEKITSRVTSSLIHSFSPYVEREAAKRFVDPPHTNVYYANSPAIAWRNGK